MRSSKTAMPPPPPDPQSPQTPPATKKKISKPKIFENLPKSNRTSPQVNVKYFEGIFEEFKVFEISCWRVTVTGGGGAHKDLRSKSCNALAWNSSAVGLWKWALED